MSTQSTNAKRRLFIMEDLLERFGPLQLASLEARSVQAHTFNDSLQHSDGPPFAAARVGEGTRDRPALAPITDVGKRLARTFRARWAEYGDVLPRWGYAHPFRQV